MWKNVLNSLIAVCYQWHATSVVSTYMSEKVILSLEPSFAVWTAKLFSFSVRFSMSNQVFRPNEHFLAIFTFQSASTFWARLFLMFVLKSKKCMSLSLSLINMALTFISLCLTKLFGHMKRALQYSHCCATRRNSFQHSLNLCC